MKYVIVTPGGTVQYYVPIMKVQTYSLDNIFEKSLLMLIPFYIFYMTRCPFMGCLILGADGSN